MPDPILYGKGSCCRIHIDTKRVLNSICGFMYTVYSLLIYSAKSQCVFLQNGRHCRSEYYDSWAGEQCGEQCADLGSGCGGTRQCLAGRSQGR